MNLIKIFKIISIYCLVSFNSAHADDFESLIYRCNASDINKILSESSKPGASLYEINNIIRMASKYYWQYTHKHQDVDFSLAQTADRRAFLKSYESCYSKIKNPTTFLSIFLVLSKLTLGKITNGYSSEFIEARNIMNLECSKSNIKEICETAKIMSDIDNPNSEIIKKIPVN